MTRSALALRNACFTAAGRAAAPTWTEERGPLLLAVHLAVVLDPFDDAALAGWWWDCTVWPSERLTGERLNPHLLDRRRSQFVGEAMVTSDERGRALGNFGAGQVMMFRNDAYWARFVPVRRDEMSDAMWRAVADRPQPIARTSANAPSDCPFRTPRRRRGASA
jgi:hypothetical protein